MDKKLLNFNKDTKTATYLHLHDDESMTVETVRDDTKLFDDNKAIHNMASTLDRWDDGKVVLRGVPFPLLEEWKAKGWFTKELFYKCLADERSRPYKVFGK